MTQTKTKSTATASEREQLGRVPQAEINAKLSTLVQVVLARP